ncbi:Origin recognition complex subunit 3 [Diatrype stigma]|uniref:Origin recognition complex subunit 3 n=1 Tax=Diatrype stigma TaxID=117547 RepID=A0AAN9YWB9_9PEZI
MSIQEGDLEYAKRLLDDDEFLATHVRERLSQSREWVVRLLRVLKYISAGKATSSEFAQLYLDAIANGVDVKGEHAEFVETVKQMQPTDAISYLTQVLDAIKEGDWTLGLNSWADEREEAAAFFTDTLANMKDLQAKAEDEGHVLRSTYSRQSKVLRTTVIAQKVQLSQDTAALTDKDKAFTDLIDRLVAHLQEGLYCERAEDMLFSEIWLYDSRTPYKDVFIPRPRAVVERALSRPHDYLGCSCCKGGETQMAPTLPTTAILYQLYLETGSLVNVADLWSAYVAIVGGENEEGLDERPALVLFYRGLAELRAMGFVKPSRKKADHIAKLAWKGL